MDAKLFTQLLSDKKVTNLKKLGYKYPQADISEFIAISTLQTLCALFVGPNPILEFFNQLFFLF